MTTPAHSGSPLVPYGDIDDGKPSGREAHAGHDVANLTSRRDGAGAIGRRVCLTCEVILGPLTLCNQPTKKGRPCTVVVRTDLGHTTCWSQGEGAGRTNTRRQKGAA